MPTAILLQEGDFDSLESKSLCQYTPCKSRVPTPPRFRPIFARSSMWSLAEGRHVHVVTENCSRASAQLQSLNLRRHADSSCNRLPDLRQDVSCIWPQSVNRFLSKPLQCHSLTVKIHHQRLLALWPPFIPLSTLLQLQDLMTTCRTFLLDLARISSNRKRPVGMKLVGTYVIQKCHRVSGVYGKNE